MRRDENLRLQIAVPDAQGMHALKFRATAPDGKEASWFSRSLIVKDGKARTSLAIALNEQIGQWKVTATDLYTKEIAKALFIVQ